MLLVARVRPPRLLPGAAARLLSTAVPRSGPKRAQPELPRPARLDHDEQTRRRTDSSASPRPPPAERLNGLAEPEIQREGGERERADKAERLRTTAGKTVQRDMGLRKRERDQAWRPSKRLTYAAMAGLKELNVQDPQEWTVGRLSLAYGISHEAVKRVLRSRYITDRLGADHQAPSVRGMPASTRVAPTRASRDGPDGPAPGKWAGPTSPPGRASGSAYEGVNAEYESRNVMARWDSLPNSPVATIRRAYEIKRRVEAGEGTSATAGESIPAAAAPGTRDEEVWDSTTSTRDEHVWGVNASAGAGAVAGAVGGGAAGAMARLVADLRSQPSSRTSPVNGKPDASPHLSGAAAGQHSPSEFARAPPRRGRDYDRDEPRQPALFSAVSGRRERAPRGGSADAAPRRKQGGFGLRLADGANARRQPQPRLRREEDEDESPAPALFSATSGRQERVSRAPRGRGSQAAPPPKKGGFGLKKR